MLFWHIFSDVKNKYAPGKACWPPAGGPGETVLLEEDKGRDRNSTHLGDTVKTYISARSPLLYWPN